MSAELFNLFMRGATKAGEAFLRNSAQLRGEDAMC
jgi:hypothetical protein